MDAGSAARAFDVGVGGDLAEPARSFRVISIPAQEGGPEASPSAGHGAVPAELHLPFQQAEAPARFGASRTVNWPVIGAIAGLHVALLIGLVTMDVVSLKLPTAEPMLVDLVPAAPPPAPPEPVIQPQLEVIPPVIVPPALDILPPQESPIQAVVAEIPPPVSQPVAVATPAPPAPVARPSAVTVSDLSTTMISAVPPRYPAEARRLKEEGTVVLLLTVGPDGRVADIHVSRSSGSNRLDNAALTAVKKWRWSPTLRNGQPVPVRGIVEIPFVLKKS